jgi:hypothetical protein
MMSFDNSIWDAGAEMPEPEGRGRNMRIGLIRGFSEGSGRAAVIPAAALGLMSVAFVAAMGWHPGHAVPGAEVRNYAAGEKPVPANDPELSPAEGLSVPAIRGDRFGNVKGWLQRKGGGRPVTSPSEARVIDAQDDRLFVELPVAALGALASLHLEFEPVEDADLLNVGAATFDVRDGEPTISAAWSASAGAQGAHRRPYLVKFDAPIREPWLADLEAAGAEIVQYQPHFGYLLLVPSGFEKKIRGRAHVAFAGEYHAEYKARAELKAKAARLHRRDVRGAAPLYAE